MQVLADVGCRDIVIVSKIRRAVPEDNVSLMVCLWSGKMCSYSVIPRELKAFQATMLKF